MSEDQWKEKLSPEQYRVMRECGTEPPFQNKYWNHHEDGTYRCAACDAPLFSSGTKFDSDTGWPSFSDVTSNGSVELVADDSLGMRRTEVKCGNCGGHLGHLFDDGPGPKGQRFCINSAALDFTKDL